MEERLGPQKFAHRTRCVISHRPKFKTEEPVFYRCPVCGNVIVQNVKTGNKAEDLHIECCGQPMEKLVLNKAGSEFYEEHKMDFTVFGGFDANSVYLSVDEGHHPMDADHHIEWMYLRTFQGGQIKFLSPRTPSSAIFMLAEEDSYVYCDRDVCRMGWEHCQFQCKRLNVGYAYCNKHGLYRVILGVYSEDK